MAIMENAKKLESEEIKDVNGGFEEFGRNIKCPKCGEERKEYLQLVDAGRFVGLIYKCKSCGKQFDAS